MPNPLLLPLLQWARGLRFPTLFAFTAATFLVNLVLPDPLPFVDELAFGLATLLLANWKRRKDPQVVHDTARRR
ncbi:DUF6116 family protein [Pseudoxanthomonas sp. J35]|uniref:DUF6116 family protein n=1 Tax=Pseudoxanthomonas sp. J35 TaxID=935852 RepID=UPI000490C2C0|nr:DUF6116 family protein [Pseudoxanthomonas sp. J35]